MTGLGQFFYVLVEGVTSFSEVSDLALYFFFFLSAGLNHLLLRVCCCCYKYLKTSELVKSLLGYGDKIH